MREPTEVGLEVVPERRQGSVPRATELVDAQPVLLRKQGKEDEHERTVEEDPRGVGGLVGVSDRAEVGQEYRARPRSRPEPVAEKHCEQAQSGDESHQLHVGEHERMPQEREHVVQWGGPRRQRSPVVPEQFPQRRDHEDHPCGREVERRRPRRAGDVVQHAGVPPSACS